MQTPIDIDSIRRDVLSNFQIETKKEPKPENCCKNCKKKNTFCEAEGSMVCTNCGLVSDRIIDIGPEWRTVNDPRKANPVRCGMMISGISSTTVAYGSNAAQLQKYLKRGSTDYSKRVIYETENEFLDLSDSTGIKPCFLKQASSMFKKLYEMENYNNKKDIHRGKKLKGIKAACLYLCLLDSEQRKPPSSISKWFGIPVEVLNTAEKQVIEKLNLYDKLPTPTTHRDLLDTLAASFLSIGISIDFPLREKAKAVGDIAKENGILLRRVPKSIAAGCLWYTLDRCTNLIKNGTVTKQNMHKCTNISGITVQKVYTELLTIQHLIDPAISRKN